MLILSHNKRNIKVSENHIKNILDIHPPLIQTTSRINRQIKSGSISLGKIKNNYTIFNYHNLISKVGLLNNIL